jgi:hypothetical protein
MSRHMSLRSKWHVAVALVTMAGQSSLTATSLAQSRSPSMLKATPDKSVAIDLHRGVAVVAVGTQSLDATWSLANRVYSDPLLRPARLDDATARVLAGESPAPGSSARVKDLAAARFALRMDDPVAARLLASMASDLEGASLLLVYLAAPSTPRARLYAPASRSFEATNLWQQPDAQGTPSWDACVRWLHAHALASSTPAPIPTPTTPSSVLKSGWFWGALGAAAGATVLALTIQRDDSPGAIHLQGKVGP